MDNREKALVGYWLDAIGQTMAALANTPSVVKDKDLSLQLDLWGSVLQGTGAALVADSAEEFSFEKLGNQLESIGNIVAIIGILAPVNDETKEKIAQKGDIIETLGVSVSLPDELKEGFTLDLFFDIFGHLLQVIEIKEVDEELVNMIAEWSQAIASILSLISVMQEEM